VGGKLKKGRSTHEKVCVWRTARGVDLENLESHLKRQLACQGKEKKGRDGGERRGGGGREGVGGEGRGRRKIEKVKRLDTGERDSGKKD